jgi:thiamine kinase-like enzyme
LANRQASAHAGHAYDIDLDTIVSTILTKKIGGPLANPVSAKLFYFDHSLAVIPYLWTLQEWVSGPAIDQPPEPRGYAELGRSVARLHSIRFNFFRRTFTSVTENWLDECERDFINFASLHAMKWDVQMLLAPFRRNTIGMSIVHNDLQPLNIINGGTKVTLIDWDNAQIAPRELDIAKVKHWTTRNHAGYLSKSDELFGAFIGGYNSEVDTYPDDAVLALCEALWLTRIIRFEQGRESTGHLREPPFPPASSYKEALRNAISDLEECQQL